jgi:DNA repair protein RadC
LRERFSKSGISAFADHEIIEFLLTFAIPRRDVKNIAKVLLHRFGSIANILDAPPDELAAVDGVGENSIALIKLVRALNDKYMETPLIYNDVLRSPEQLIDFLQMKLSNRRKECFFVLFLDKQRRLLHTINVPGTVDKVAVFPNEIAVETLRCHASSVIIAHNHPGGNLRPSEADMKVTQAIQMSLSCIGVPLLEHYLISGGKYIPLLDAAETFQQ